MVYELLFGRECVPLRNPLKVNAQQSHNFTERAVAPIFYGIASKKRARQPASYPPMKSDINDCKLLEIRSIAKSISSSVENLETANRSVDRTSSSDRFMASST